MLDLLGRGPAYPLNFALGPDDMAEGETLIEMSIDQILGTAQGERLMRPDFGSKLHHLLFDNPSQVTEALAAAYVEDALERWEPRVTVLDVTARANGNTLAVGIQYVINATNDVRNKVYVQPLRGESVGSD